jgi:hypothetical protein
MAEIRLHGPAEINTDTKVKLNTLAPTNYVYIIRCRFIALKYQLKQINPLYYWVHKEACNVSTLCSPLSGPIVTQDTQNL